MSSLGRPFYIVFFWLAILLFAWLGMALYTYTRGLPFPIIFPDTLDHIEAIEYLLKQGHYWPDFRMPSIGVLYGAFYLFLQNRGVSMFLLSIAFLIIILASALVSISYGYSYTGKAWVAHGIGSIWLTSPIALQWYWLLPDPLMAALNVTTIIALLRNRYVLAGIMITGLFLLRPIAAVILIPVFIYIWFTHKSQRLRALVLLLLPLAVVESSWIVRNYLRYREFRPFYGTGTLTDATCGPYANYIIFLFRHLGAGAPDTKDVCILTGHCNENIKDFFRTFPEGYFSEKDKALIEKYLSIVAIANKQEDDSSRCEIDRALEKQRDEILSKVQIPWLRRRTSTLTKALFTIIIQENGYSYSGWITSMVRYPLYSWASVGFLLVLLFFTLLMVFCLLRKKLEPSYLLWYSFGALGSLSYFLIGFIEQRYLIQYYPTLSIGALLMVATCFSRK